MDGGRILIVDDERSIRDMLAIALAKEGFGPVCTAATGHEALDLACTWQPEAVVLDVMLPDMDGFAVLGELRRFSAAPALFLTARGSDPDKLRAFGLGADDYVTKPFNPLEVAARLRAHMRRAGPGDPSPHAAREVYDLGRCGWMPTPSR